jgi:hypothetical protein
MVPVLSQAEDLSGSVLRTLSRTGKGTGQRDLEGTLIMANYAHGMHATYSAPWLNDLSPEEKALGIYGPEEVMIEEVLNDEQTLIVVRPLGSDTLIETSPPYLSEPWGTECKH